jgi:hypothetical protein
MSEQQTLVQQADGVVGVAPRPRISADAFRNLAARLKKPDTQIPAMQPVLAPVAVEVVQAVTAPVVIEPAPSVVVREALPVPILAEPVVEPA